MLCYYREVDIMMHRIDIFLTFVIVVIHKRRKIQLGYVRMDKNKNKNNT